MDQRFHVIFHFLAGWRNDLEVPEHHVARVFLQPVHALQDNFARLPHFLNPDQVTVITIAINPDRDIEIHFVIHGVGLFLAQIPLDS